MADSGHEEFGSKTEQPGRVKEGWLMKRGNKFRTWKPKYCVLQSDGSLCCFKDSTTNVSILPICKRFFVRGCRIPHEDKPRNFFIVHGEKGTKRLEKVFCSMTPEERLDWCNALQITADRNTTLQRNRDQTRPIRELSDFELVKLIGKGTFGKVFVGRERSTGHPYAIKLLRKDLIIGNGEIDHTLTELEVLQRIRHPFLTYLKYAFQTKERLCFVMEYVSGGELFFHLSREKRFDESRTRFYVAEITLALGYLHENNVLYRDLKLENILLDQTGHIKLTDFGLCKINLRTDQRTGTFCGTPEYLAPEILEDRQYDRVVDWWSLGIVTYEMLCGYLPFQHRNQQLLFEIIKKCDLRLPSHLTREAKSFLVSLLTKCPLKRLGAGPTDFKEVQSHAFFTCIVWSDVLSRKVKPPFIPQIDSDIDTRYFSAEFTKGAIQFTPTDVDEFDNTKFTKFAFPPVSSNLTPFGDEEIVNI